MFLTNSFKNYLLLKKLKVFFLYCCILFHRIIRNVNLSTLLSFSSPSNEREEEKKEFVPIVLIYIFIGAVCVLADCWVFGQQSHSCLERRGGRPITLTILSSIQSKVAKEDIFTFSDYFFKTSAWLVAHIDKVGLKNIGNCTQEEFEFLIIWHQVHLSLVRKWLKVIVGIQIATCFIVLRQK